MHDSRHIVVGLLADASELDVAAQEDERLRDNQVPLRVVLLAADVAVGDGDDEIDERIEGILLEAVHVLDERVAVRARHDGEVGVDETERQVVHVLGAEAYEELLLIERRTQADHDAHVAPQLVRVLVLEYEVLEYVEGALAVVLEYAREQAAEVDTLVPVHALFIYIF